MTFYVWITFFPMVIFFIEPNFKKTFYLFEIIGMDKNYPNFIYLSLIYIVWVLMTKYIIVCWIT